MFEQMLKEHLIKLLQDDLAVRNAITPMLAKIAREVYNTSVQEAVKWVIENDETVQDVIRKQATTDIWEAIEDDVDMRIDKAIDNLVIRRAN